MADPNCKVNVYTEWSPLKEIIVGNALNFNHRGIDILFRFMYQNWDNDFRDKTGQYELAEQYIQERQEDLDGLAKMLEGYGVVVRRPDALTEISEFKTPTFSSVVNACDSPRDMFMMYGNEIIETPPTNPKRYFEHLLFREIFRDYFDSGAKWTVAPRPILTEQSTDFSFWEDTLRTPLNSIAQIGQQYDIAFDAANCQKYGADILMNCGTKNHELGAMWLARNIGEGRRVRAIRLTDSHIDWQIIPLRPGKLLVHDHYMKSKYDLLPLSLQKWDRLAICDPMHPFEYPADHLQMASSNGMDINVLSLDENRVFIRDSAVRTAEMLYKAGFEPIPVRFRHCELFGDAIHCATVDVRRADSCEVYL